MDDCDPNTVLHVSVMKDSNKDEKPNKDPCPICLSLISQHSSSCLDRCFHEFCYKCILRWIQVVSSRSTSLPQPSSIKCPLCKTENFSIIFGYDGSTFQKHFINQNNSNSNFFSKDHKYRLQCYYTFPEPRLLSDAFKVERFWKLNKYLQPNNWLEKWLRRELQALIQEEDVEIIMHHILGVIDTFTRSSYSKQTTHSAQQKQQEFKVIVADAALPFLTARTKRFVDEMELFLASGLAVEYYDRAYRRCLGWKQHGETSEDGEQTSREQEPIASHLYILDEDLDDIDWAEG
ncbi:uncharacterized protein LOC130828089 [Amaranthus tricolor]|uniref:uncharacterized protein LOC130828089 n=1 Tax=Amaranthus tricolor TaxID=29722 RepID=UPI0025843B6B|nr:uncharacterized protein LOC130828089 [Amaranthus tricolor]